jgi:hypothetical protein
MTIVNCIRFKPKKGLEEDCFKALSDYETKYSFKKRVASYVLDIDDGEYAAIGIWNTVDDFMDAVNRDERWTDCMRPYLESYEDGDHYQSFSGPDIDIHNFFSISGT